jgi:flagellar biosynthesis protein FliR
MHADLRISASTLIAFLFVLTRMLGVFVFVPLPFKDAGPSMSRVVLALGCTIALYPCWPSIDMSELTIGSAAALLFADAALGAAIGLMVGFLAEAFTLGAQSLALQAGYGYASVVDPTTQADSDVMAVMAQLLSGLFFVTTGLHRLLLKVFAESLTSYPPGTFVVTRSLATNVVRVGSGIFSFGLRLALPLIGLLLMAEITLALLGRINGQLHLGMHAFPVKMMLTLAILSSVLAVTPHLYHAYAEEIFGSIRRSFVR